MHRFTPPSIRFVCYCRVSIFTFVEYHNMFWRPSNQHVLPRTNGMGQYLLIRRWLRLGYWNCNIPTLATSQMLIGIILSWPGTSLLRSRIVARNDVHLTSPASHHLYVHNAVSPSLSTTLGTASKGWRGQREIPRVSMKNQQSRPTILEIGAAIINTTNKSAVSNFS